MSRLVRIPRQAPSFDNAMLEAGGMAPPPGANPAMPDTYLERVAKYVPAEVLAFSVVINAILDQTMRSSGTGATMAGFPVTTIALGALIVGLVLTPLFVWYVRVEGDAWITNAFVSTLAFPFWAYAMGNVAFADHRDGNLAVILLATFTVISGLISPRQPRARRVRKSSAVPVEASYEEEPEQMAPPVQQQQGGPRLVGSLPSLSA